MTLFEVIDLEVLNLLKKDSSYNSNILSKIFKRNAYEAGAKTYFQLAYNKFFNSPNLDIKYNNIDNDLLYDLIKILDRIGIKFVYDINNRGLDIVSDINKLDNLIEFINKNKIK